MKIVHYGDCHYEEAKGRRAGGPDGIDHGWWDVARAVERIVDKAIECGQSEPTVLMFGGDLALHRRPTRQTNAHFAAQIARAHNAGVETIALTGNHDVDRASSTTTLQPFTSIPGFHLWTEPGIAWLHGDREGVSVRRTPGTAGGEVAAVVMMPWVQKSIAAANADTTADELLPMIAAAATAVIRGLVVEAQQSGVPVFLAYHGSVSGATTPTGTMVELFTEPVLDVNDLGTLGLAGVLLNHVHKRQSIGSSAAGSTPVVYSSSVERLTFGEQRDEKGAVIWTVPKSGAVAPFEYFDSSPRRFVTMTELLQPAAAYDVADAIVRVRLPAGTDVNTPRIRAELIDAGAHNVTEIVVESVETHVTHEASDVARFDPIEALRVWLLTEHPDEPQEWHDAMVAAGVDAVRGDLLPASLDVPHTPTTEAEFAALPVLDLSAALSA
jgi:exonuclease SbcD